MDLILWRHADAEEENLQGDLARPLTARGQRQAKRVGVWLEHMMPLNAKVLVSPALRTRQTAQSLNRRYQICKKIAPDRSADDLLKEVDWPNNKRLVLVVGHQPTLGLVAARLLGDAAKPLSIRKGAVWWLKYRTREEGSQVVLYCVQNHETVALR